MVKIEKIYVKITFPSLLLLEISKKLIGKSKQIS
jgi:hypothetical protein